MPKFNDLNIQALFGVEDAENEKPERLKEYFLRNKSYKNLMDGLPIRVLVGHKGVGKSALLRVAYMEDESNSQLAVWLQPDDLHKIAISESSELNTLIREWKEGITNVVFQKICEHYVSSNTNDKGKKITAGVSSLISSVTEFFSKRYHDKLDPMARKVMDKFSNNQSIVIYIDDLDRGWKAQKDDITRISALLNAVRDLVGYKDKMKFRIGLRSDVYFLVRTSDESTDKIEQNIVWLTWTNHEILSVMAKRVETFFGRSLDQNQLKSMRQPEVAKFLNSVVEAQYHGAGKWDNAPTHRILLSLTRKRPRDLVKLLSGAAREAHKNDKEIIGTNDLRNTFEAYSGERLQDIINEFRSELPEISKLLYGMRPTSKEKKTSKNYLYSNDMIVNKIRNIIQQSNFRFTNGGLVSPITLAQFLYKIDFITARKDQEEYVIRRYFDQSSHLQNQFVDFGFHWEVHPAYRWALQPGELDKLFHLIDLEDDK